MTDRVSQLAEKEASWRIHLEAQLASGESVRTYCRRLGLLESSFRYWRRVIAARDAGVQSPPVEGAGLVAVQVVGELAVPPSNHELLEIELVGGLVVRLREDVPIDCLQRVLTVCHHVCRASAAGRVVRSC